MNDATGWTSPLVLAAPSGTGKTTIARRLVEVSDRMEFSVSVTTRPRREHEREGVDYHFVSPEAFEAMRAEGELVEWAEVHGHLYGTPRRALSEPSARADRQVVLDIDVQGARKLKQAVPEAILVFVLPPSADVLVGRLRARGTEGESGLLQRLTNARDELAAAADFDFVVVNENLEDAVADVRAIASGHTEHALKAQDATGGIVRLQRNIDLIIEQEFTRDAN